MILEHCKRMQLKNACCTFCVDGEMTEMSSRVAEAAISEGRTGDSPGYLRKRLCWRIWGWRCHTLQAPPLQAMVTATCSCSCSACISCWKGWKQLQNLKALSWWDFMENPPPCTHLIWLQLAPSKRKHCSPALCPGKGNCHPQPPLHPQVCF